MPSHRVRSGVRIAAAAVMATAMLVGRASAAVTDDELKCQQGASLAVGKFVGSKAKCLTRCEMGARKGANPATDCVPPYAGATADCVAREEGKARSLEISKCKKDCPECYAGGDCSADATTRVADVEAQIDLLRGSVYCDDSGSPDGLNKQEAKCQDTVAKTLGTYVMKSLKCQSTCRSDEQKGKVPPGSCTPPPSDPKTSACRSKEAAKAASLIDKQCSPSVNPKADAPECYGTQTGAGWTALGTASVDAGDAGLYCGSPSGAFID